MELAGDGLSELGKGRSIRELRHYGCVCHLNNPNKAFREGNFAQRIVQLISGEVRHGCGISNVPPQLSAVAGPYRRQGQQL